MMGYGSTIAVIVIVLIQIAQQILFVTLVDAESPIIITPFFNLVMVWNSGISFGMLQYIPQGQWVLSGVASMIVIALLFWLKKLDDRYTATALGLIIGGAMGNIIDRVRFSVVFDYLDFYAFGHHWPAFNLADSFIFIGVSLLFISSFKSALAELKEGKIK